MTFHRPMRAARIALTGWYIILYIQSVCLPVDLVLSGLSPTEAKPACRCKITSVHGKWCRCPCCVGSGHEAVTHGESVSCAIEGHEGEAPEDAQSCCRAGKTSAVSSSGRIVPAGCGCGPVADSAVVSPSFSFHLAEDGIAVREPSCAEFASDYRMGIPYSILPDLPDKIPL